MIDLTKLKPRTQVNEQPLVSVIVPCYNVEQYIDQCLTSILDNGYSNIELLCIDDRSTDSTVKHIKALMKKDKRIQLFKNKLDHNIYGGACRNIGLDHAKGKYVYFCDSDDYILPGLIPGCVEKMERLNAEICCFKYLKLSPDSGFFQEMTYCLRMDKLDKSFEIYNHENTNDILQITYPQVWAKFYNREFVQRCGVLFGTTKNSNDVRFSICTQLSAKRIVYIPKVFYVYRFGTRTSVQLDRINSDSGNDFILSVKETWEYVKGLNSKSAEQQFVDWVSTQITWNIPKRDSGRQRNFVDQLVEFFTKIGYCFGNIKSMLLGFNEAQYFDSIINDKLHSLYVNSDAFTKKSDRFSSLVEQFVSEFGKERITEFVFSKLKGLAFDKMYETTVKYLPFLIQKPKKRMLRNIALYYNWISSRGGIQTFIECSIKMFKKMGYNVILVTSTPKDQLKIDIDGIKVEVIGKRLKYWDESIDNILAYEKELNAILVRNSIDLFYTQDWCHYITLFDLITANNCGCFTLMHYHNNPLAKKRNNSPLWRSQYDMLKYFDHCISLSSCAEQFFNWVGVHNKYIPNIISDELNSLIDERPTNEKEIDVLWVGRLCKAKGVERLLWVLKNLQKKNANRTLKVKIIGVWYNDFGSEDKFKWIKSHFLSEVKSMCESGKLDITMQEEYDSTKIYCYMKSSKVLLYTSIYDGYPYVVAEALANGLPIVAYSQPEIELFKDENCVYQFVDSEYASMLVFNVLNLPSEEYAKRQCACKQFMRGIYRQDNIEQTWKWMLDDGIFETIYASNKVSDFFKMMLNNI